MEESTVEFLFFLFCFHSFPSSKAKLLFCSFRSSAMPNSGICTLLLPFLRSYDSPHPMRGITKTLQLVHHPSKNNEPLLTPPNGKNVKTREEKAHARYIKSKTQRKTPAYSTHAVCCCCRCYRGSLMMRLWKNVPNTKKRTPKKERDTKTNIIASL